MGQEIADSNIGINLVSRLSKLKEVAVRSLSNAIRPTADSSCGYIEAVSIDMSGLVWVLGWITRDALVDRPAIIIDSSKHPAGFAYTLVPRGDLPDGATGIIGVFQTDWRPTPSCQPLIFLDADSRTFMRALSPLDVVRPEVFQARSQAMWAEAHTGHTAALQNLMMHPTSWMPMHHTEKAAVDVALFLPNFGCVISGWSISATKEVQSFVLKNGSNVLSSDPLTMAFEPRPDLEGVVPGAGRALDRAGFRAVLRGQIDVHAVENSVLKLIYSDGSASNHPVDPHAFVRLGTAAGYDRISTLYRRVAAEPFFADFARAVCYDQFIRASTVMPFTVKAASNAVVFACPADESDVTLLFYDIRRNIDRLSTEDGIVILMQSNRNRDVVIGLFDELSRISMRRCSLFIVNDSEMAAYSLFAVLQQAEIENFTFVGASTMLTDAGWAYTSDMDGSLRFMEACDPANIDPSAGRSGFDCFAWNAAGWRGHMSRNPPLCGGAGMLPPDVPGLGAIEVLNAATSTRLAVPSSFTEAVNNSVRATPR